MSQKINDFSKLDLFPSIPQDNVSSIQSQLIEQIARSSFDSLKALYAELGPEAKSQTSSVLDLKGLPFMVQKKRMSFFLQTESLSKLSKTEKVNLVKILNSKSHYGNWPILRVLFEELQENQAKLTSEIKKDIKLQKVLINKGLLQLILGKTVSDTPCFSFLTYSTIEDLALDIFNHSNDKEKQIHILEVLKTLRSFLGVTDIYLTFLNEMKTIFSSIDLVIKKYQKASDLNQFIDNYLLTTNLLINLLKDKNNFHFLCNKLSMEFIEGNSKFLSIDDFLPILDSAVSVFEAQKINDLSKLLKLIRSNLELLHSLETNEQKSELKIKKHSYDVLKYSKEILKISSSPFYEAHNAILCDLHNDEGSSGLSVQFGQQLVLFRESLTIINRLIDCFSYHYNTNFNKILERICLELPYARWHKLQSLPNLRNEHLNEIAKKIDTIRIIKFSDVEKDFFCLEDPIDLFFGNYQKVLKTHFEGASTAFTPEASSTTSAKSPSDLATNTKPYRSSLNSERRAFLKYNSIESFLSKNIDKNSYDLRIKEIHSEFFKIINDLPLESRTKKLEKEIQEVFTKCFERHIIEGLILHDYEYSCNNKILPLSKIIPEEILEMTFFSFPKIFEPGQTSSATEASSVREFDPERYQCPQPNDIEDEEDDTEEYENPALHLGSIKTESDELSHEEKELLQELKEATNYRETMYVLKKYHRYLKKYIFTKEGQLPLLSKYEENRMSKSGHGQLFGVTISTHNTNIPLGTRNSMSSQLETTMRRIHKETTENKKQ